MTFPRTVLAYLTGWLIVQPVYNRLLSAYRRRELERPGSATHAYYREQARAIVDELEERGHLARPARRDYGPLGTPHPGWERGPSGHPQLGGDEFEEGVDG